MNKNFYGKRVRVILLIILMLVARRAECQHSIDVQRAAARMDYFQALETYMKMPRRTSTTASTIAAAKSAWALSLPQLAIEEFDRALQDDSLDPVDRARLLISRGVIEFQEGRYQISNHFAEQAVRSLKKPSPLRAKGWMLWGQDAYELGQYGSAEAKFVAALKETAAEDAPDINYQLGLCRLKLGRQMEARENFENVPLEHEMAPNAIRHLADIALSAGNFSSAEFWLNTGRKQFADAFLDSWVDYALLRVAVDASNTQKVREIRLNAQSKYPPSDQWLNLIEAAAELYEWKRGAGATSERKSAAKGVTQE
jgi:tetratricopeptide (TPR) repeat protein